jgi:hypothetical protein
MNILNGLLHPYYCIDITKERMNRNKIRALTFEYRIPSKRRICVDIDEMNFAALEYVLQMLPPSKVFSTYRGWRVISINRYDEDIVRYSIWQILKPQDIYHVLDIEKCIDKKYLLYQCGMLANAYASVCRLTAHTLVDGQLVNDVKVNTEWRVADPLFFHILNVIYLCNPLYVWLYNKIYLRVI